MGKDLTQGSVLRTVAGFALPYLLSYFLQTLYGMADLYIIGRFNGVESTTAVAIGSQFMHLVTVMIVGLSMGVTVTVGHAYGGKRKEEASALTGNAVLVFSLTAVLLTVLLLFLVKPVTDLLRTPEEAGMATRAYLSLCFLGIPFITAYNLLSSIFRGLGDSRSPIAFIFSACVLNIVLDYVFIGFLKLGAAGAALATTIAQALSSVLALLMLIRRDSGIKLRRSSFRPQPVLIRSILRNGIPVASQDGFMQVSFLLVTVIANQRGLADSAAVGIVEKMITFIFLVPSSMLSTVSAVASQCFGAGDRERARSAFRVSLYIAVLWGISAMLFTECFKGEMIALFTDSPEVVALGSGYISSYVVDTIFAGIHFCFSGYFCAAGKSYLSFLHNALSVCLLRLPVAYLASLRFPDTLFPMGLAPLSGSALSVLICVICYKRMNQS